MAATQDPRLDAAVRPTVEGMGFRLLRVRMTGGGHRPTLQVMAERPDGGMGIEDCALLSRALSAALDVADPIAGGYTLEVTSPGIDRPLVDLEDYRRFAGLEARIETREPLDGQRRFKGRLAGVEGDGMLVLVADKGEVRIPHGAVHAAKLVLNDELIARTAGKEMKR
ncbi:MAG: ribosome maturation factor RimP [Alphaproteobacteria bacterium]|nr:ribosome maturation factor RimP [Alphaproteobacteria bacterium]